MHTETKHSSTAHPLSQSPSIGIIGIGKLGLCFALNLERTGYRVMGTDINETYVELVNDKKLISYEPQVEEYLKASKHFTASTQLSDILHSDCEFIFIVVATPSLPNGKYNHQQVEAVLSELMAFGKAEKQRHLVLMCTTMPGYSDTMAERLAPYNYTVSYNPEFIAQGSIMRDQQEPDQVLIGEPNPEVGQKLEDIYRNMCLNEPTFCRMSRLSAEICKIATNCFLTTKISFANSIGDLATKVGAEPDKILSAIGADKRIGGRYLKYGFGFGGPCFPRDNRALGVFAEESGYELLISKATDEVNSRHLDFQVQQWLCAYPKEEQIVFDHITYKKGSTMIEESQQLALAVKLAQAGRKVKVQGPQVVMEEVKGIYGDLLEYEIV